ncbi:MAG: MEDS domain-containing protein [Nibricoccus sp.]
MNQQTPTISLGFTQERFPAGVHICQIYTEDREREEALARFVESGLVAGERTSCFSDKKPEPVLSRHLAAHGMSLEERCSCGALTLAPTRDVYFKDDRFDPERMLSVLTTYHEDSMRRGHRACRVIGEMSTKVQTVEGGNRLLEYESKVSMLLREHPITCVCQYDARAFSGAMIMDVLKVHPLMIIRGAVVRNPFFIPPEEFLAEGNSSRKV